MLLSLCALLLCFCKEEAKTHSQVNLPNEIVLIIKEPVVNNRLDLPGGGYTSNGSYHEIEYVDQRLVPHFIPLDYEADADTISIPTSQEVLEVTVAYKALDNLSYLFRRGDSVLIDYMGRLPSIQLLNRRVDQLDYEIEGWLRTHIHTENLPSEEIINRPFFYHGFQLGAGEQEFKRIQKIAWKSYQKETHQIMQLLDSLKQQNSISERAYLYYQAKYQLKPYLAQIGDLVSMKIGEIIDPRSDSLMMYRFHRQKVFQYHKVQAFHAYERGVRPQASYDMVRTSDLYTDLEKKILFMDCFNEIVKVSSRPIIQEYFDKFREDMTDSSVVQYVQSRVPGLGEPMGKNMQLMGLDSSIMEFSDLLALHQGKLIYIDFWASWCRPCIAAFPDSKELNAQFEGQEVEFVYLSIDDSHTSWYTSSNIHGITKNSFLITNRLSSSLFEDLSIRSIPRYLLVNKEGNIVEHDAPGPGNKQIETFLENYLLK